MEPGLFLHKVSTLQVVMELLVHLGSGTGTFGKCSGHITSLTRTVLKNAGLGRVGGRASGRVRPSPAHLPELQTRLPVPSPRPCFLWQPPMISPETSKISLLG